MRMYFWLEKLFGIEISDYINPSLIPTLLPNGSWQRRKCLFKILPILDIRKLIMYYKKTRIKIKKYERACDMTCK